MVCRERPEKAAVCARLGITHFVDDRLDVLTPMRGTVPHLYLFGAPRAGIPEWITPAPDWSELVRVLGA